MFACSISVCVSPSIVPLVVMRMPRQVALAAAEHQAACRLHTEIFAGSGISSGVGCFKAVVARTGLDSKKEKDAKFAAKNSSRSSLLDCAVLSNLLRLSEADVVVMLLA